MAQSAQHPQPTELKQSSHLNLQSSWKYRHVPLHPANFLILCRDSLTIFPRLVSNSCPQSLALSLRLECCRAIMAHCSFQQLGSSNPLASASQRQSCSAAQPHLELLGSSDSPASASQRAGITGMSLRTQPHLQLHDSNPVQSGDSYNPQARIELHGGLDYSLHCYGSPSVAKAGVQWCNHSSLQPRTPALKRSSCLSLPKTGSCYVTQAGLKLLASSDPPTSAFQSTGITGLSHPSGSNIFLIQVSQEP
ncbi:UPF0764 protein C16orf89 [Plecturocebus cupreus]